MKRRRSRRKRRSYITEVSLTPLIDTALTLLIIFMITSPMMNNAIKVNLPKGKAKEDDGMRQEMIVYIDEKEHMFFNSIPMITDDQVIAAIKDTVGQDSKRTVFVKADTAVRYGQVIELVDKIKVVGGVEYVALATKKST